MYGLPHDFDGSFLIGKELESICFNSNQVVFGFTDAIKIISGSTFSFGKRDSTDNVELASVPVSSSSSMQLIGAVVNDVKWSGDGSFILHFERGILSFMDDSREYESYEIHHQGKVVVV
jgi:hypothetical protein